jgi:hypothetical protein
MTRPNLGIKVLGLCALVFALMGVAASGTQAATWLVLEGGGVTEGVGGEVVLEKDTTLILHTKISGIAVLYTCTTIKAINVKLAAAGTIAKGGKIDFGGCITKLNEAESKVCEPTNAGTEKGLIVTKFVHSALVLNAEKEELLETAPDEGETLATIEMSKECAIGTKVPLIGALLLKDCEKAFLIHKEFHLFEASPGTVLFVISKTEEHKATLLGSWFAKVRTGGLFRAWAGHV